MKLPTLSTLNARFSGPRSNAWEVADRAFELEAEGRDIIHLSIGDPDIDTPEIIRDAAISALQAGRTHYSAISGETTLREAVCAQVDRVYGKKIEVNQTVILPGAQSALFSTFTCIAGPGQEVILLEPAYATYDGVAAAGGATVVGVPLDAEKDFALDLTAIEAAINEKTAAILLNSPGNPTGKLFSRTDMQAMLELARKHGFWLVSDEVYSTLVYNGEHVSPFGLEGAEKHVIVINSVSKAYAMTGWRIGWVIAPKEVAIAIGDLAQISIFGVSQFSQDAATVALSRGANAAADHKQVFQRRRDVLYSHLSQIKGLGVYEPEGGMFMLVNISRSGMKSEKFAHALLDRVGVAVVPGCTFGDTSDNHVRIGFLQEESVLIDAAKRIAAFMDEFG
jgi:arginine:pyruvate transaminase